MGKLNILFLIAVMFFTFGCSASQVQIDPAGQEAIAKITGRHAGNALAKKYPDTAKELILVCNDIVKESNPDIVATLARSIALTLSDSQIDDLLLKADIKDILVMIKIQSGITVTAEQILIIKAVAEGLISGIEIYQQQ